MQNIPRWKKSDRGSSHFRHGLDPRLEYATKTVVCVFCLTKTHTFENSLVWPEPKTKVNQVLCKKDTDKSQY